MGRNGIRLCEASLSDEGIRDSIRCCEYMGRFYVQEGNKRVSVLKSYGNPVIPAYVTRIIPKYSNDIHVWVYYEFMRFYKLSGLYSIQFHRLGEYEKLQVALGFEPDHVWTIEERRKFIAGFSRLKETVSHLGMKDHYAEPEDILLVWLEVFPFANLIAKTSDELLKGLRMIWPDVDNLAHNSPIEVSTEPREPDKRMMSVLFGLDRPSYLTVAFIYTARPEDSRWIRAHEMGRRYLLEKMGEQITANACVCSAADAFKTMEKAIQDGAQIVFAVTPPLISVCRKIAALYPSVKILNCSLSMPYPGVRTYYSRVYEAKFIAGIIAGCMADDNKIGYVADYPIFGVPASINAFTLGARAVNPRARITLRWSCVDDDPVRELEESGIHVVSRFENSISPHTSWDWSLFQTQKDGLPVPLAAPCWHWRKFYVKVINGIFTGAWSNAAKQKYSAVNYFWGIDSGVIDIRLSDDLPDGVCTLAMTLRRGIIEGHVEPFRCRMTDQIGVTRCDGTHGLSPEEILNMDWLLGCIDGSIPAFDELKESSRDLVRYLGIYRDKISPEVEEVSL